MEKHLKQSPTSPAAPHTQAEWVAWRVRELLAAQPRPPLRRLQGCIEAALSEQAARHLAAVGPISGWHTWRTRRQGLRFAVAGLEIEVHVTDVRGPKVRLQVRAPRGVAVSWLGAGEGG